MNKISLYEFYGGRSHKKSTPLIKSSLIMESVDFLEYNINVEGCDNIVEFDIYENSCDVYIRNTISEDKLGRRTIVKFANEVSNKIVEFIDNHGDINNLSIGISNDDENLKSPPLLKILNKVIERKSISGWKMERKDHLIKMDRLEEMNTTASAGGEYATPYAFAKKEKDKKKAKRLSSYYDPSLHRM